MSFSLEKLQQDLAIINVRKEQAMHQFHQLLGAGSIIEQMIQKLLNPEPEAPEAPPVSEQPVQQKLNQGE
jgi:hypothetical protein